MTLHSLIGQTAAAVAPPIHASICPSDWIDAANAMFAMVAALAAVAAVRLAVRETRSSRTEKAADRWRDTYQRVALEPLLRALAEFSTAASHQLEARRSDVENMSQKSTSHMQILATCKGIADDFNERFFGVRVQVRQAMIAWNDEDLSIRIDDRMQLVQDGVVDEIERLSTGSPPAATRLASALGESIARVMRDLVAYEPKAVR